MYSFGGRLKAFANNRWLVFVASMWIQSCAGIGYLFGSISPVIKSAMGYNQRQVALLGVAKDLGDSIGFIAGSMCEVLPIWVILLIGVIQNFVGYGLVWLVVIGVFPSLPLWVLCIAIFVGTNGETYFNTAALVTCVQNFPKSRGPIVGILKGFAGLSGAILSQVYALFNFSSESSLILMIAVGPSIVTLALMFIVRPVGGHRQLRPSDGKSFTFVYGICLLLAGYLISVLLAEDVVDLSRSVIIILAVLLLVIILLPILIPIILTLIPEPLTEVEVNLLPGPQTQQPSLPRGESQPEVIFSEVESEVEDERSSSGSQLLEPSLRKKRIIHLQAKLFQAAAEGAVRVKSRKGPRRGENFTLLQALMKADFWIMFFSLVLASGSGLTIIDNLGQLCESIGYTDTSIFVSMISIFNFLGRVGGGYFSEVVVRKYAYPRPVAMAIVQVFMAIGLFYYAMAWPGAIYVVTVLIGAGYGAHWAIVPAAVSELFGLKSFGALYNFLTLASPAGSLIFSGVIASGIYDYEAEKQAALRLLSPNSPLGADSSLTCTGTICYSLTCAIMSGLCIIAVGLSMIVVYRTKSVYANLYVKLHG